MELKNNLWAERHPPGSVGGAKKFGLVNCQAGHASQNLYLLCHGHYRVAQRVQGPPHVL